MAQKYADDAFLLGLYPEASAVDPAQRLRWLSYAQGVVPLSTFEVRSDDAHASMTMHLLAMQGLLEDEGVGGITSMSLGPGSVSFDAGAAIGDAGLEETKYGKHFKLLQNTILAVVWV